MEKALGAETLLAAVAPVQATLVVEHANGAFFCVIILIVLTTKKRSEPSVEDHLAQHSLVPCESNKQACVKELLPKGLRCGIANFAGK